MRRKLIGAVLLVGGMLFAAGAAAENLSPATKRLFDAVWADDIARVKASLVDGADLTATNEFGVRAVDLAVDKGHYDIAHYLLSVEKLRDDTSTTARPAGVPAPAVAQPAPAPVAVTTVSPAPMAGAVAPTLPAVMPPPTASAPPPQAEKMWKPPAEGNEAQSPKLKVIGTARPQPVNEAQPGPVASATAMPAQPPAAGAPTPKPAESPPSSNVSDQPDKPGLFDKVKDLFRFSSEAKPDPQQQQTPSTLAAAEIKPAAKPPETKSSGGESVENAVTEPPPAASTPEASKAPEIAALSQSETTARKSTEPSPLERLADFFRSGDAPPKNAEALQVAEKPAASAPLAAGETSPQSPPGKSPETPPEVPVVDEASSPPPAAASATDGGGASKESGPTILKRIVTFLDKHAEQKPGAGENTSIDQPRPPAPPSTPMVKASVEQSVATQPMAEPAATRSDGGPTIFDKLAKIFKPQEDQASSGAAASGYEANPVGTMGTASRAEAPKVAEPPSVSKPVPAPVEVALPTPKAAAQRVGAPETANEETDLLTTIARALRGGDKQADGAAENPVGRSSVTPPAKQVASAAPSEAPKAETAAPATETVTANPVPPAAKVETTAPRIDEAQNPSAPAPKESGRGFLDGLKSWLNRDEASPPPEAKPSMKIIDTREQAATGVPNAPTAKMHQAAQGAPRRVRPAMVSAAPPPAPEKVVAPEAKPVQAPKTVTPKAAAPETVPETVPETARKMPETASLPSAPNVVSRRVRAPRVGPPVENPAQIRAPMIASAALKDVGFLLGEGMALGAKVQASKAGAGTCVEKSRWRTMFCIEPVIWPSAIAPSFRAQSQIYRGEKAIVQYVDGQSVQMHVLFPSSALWSVSEYFKKQYGPPTEMPEVWTALIGAPKRPNRVLRWHSRNTKTGAETLLEIREIDDLRWSAPPDTKHGVVRILEKGRGSVFQLLSATDLMLVSLRNRAQ